MRLVMQCVILCVLAAWCAGQSDHAPEFFPRDGEVRFNKAVYKASHNSYERSEPLWEQVDRYNTWMIELDLFWDEGQADGGISVEHFCFSAHNAQSLNWELDELNQSSIKAMRPTVIILDMKAGDGPCYQDWPSADVYRPLIRQSFIDCLGGGRGEDYFYTAAEFKDANGDNQRWPSAEELVRRGKRWIVIIGDDDSRRPDSDFFFGITFRTRPSDGGVENRVLANIDMGCDGFPFPGPVDDTPETLDDRWMYRAYPNGGCDICSGQNGAYWDNAVMRGFTFVATNCIDDDHTWDALAHSPMPVFASPSATGSSERGTITDPFTGSFAILNAVFTASPGVPVLIPEGTHPVILPNVLPDGPRQLRSLGGITRLVRP